jgi:hypothetical protein
VEKAIPTSVPLIHFYIIFVLSLSCLDRNHVPWAVISSCIFTCLLLVLLLRFMLARENKRRENQPRDERYDAVFIDQELADGTRVEKRVDKVFLDLTDLQNRDFRYAL